MTLSELKTALTEMDSLNFHLPSGERIPPHFHLTEIGLTERTFIDCGNTHRKSSKVNFQFYTAQDVDHRLAPSTLAKIITKAEEHLPIDNLEVEVEYQLPQSKGLFGLQRVNNHLQLVATHTDCLAKSDCGIPAVANTIAKRTACC